MKESESSPTRLKTVLGCSCGFNNLFVMEAVKQWAILVLIGLLCTACATFTKQEQGDPVEMRYATLLTMSESDSFTVVTIVNPWHKEKVLAQYVLVPKVMPLPSQLPQGTVVRTPLEHSVVTSSVHLSLLSDLHATASVAGVTDVNYIISDTLQRLAAQCTDVGSSMQPDGERVRALKADAVLVSSFDNAHYGVLETIGVPLIECADYMEISPLARAEWMRFFGRLYGCAAQADSLFADIESRYNALRQKAVKQKQRATVMCDLLTSGVWYQPGGHSTMAQFINDAGGNYLWQDRPESGSLSLNLESVYARARKADVWLVKYGQTLPLTYGQMAVDCPQYKQFAPWQKRKVYACNTLHVPFYEETPFHPDRLLANLMSVLGTGSANNAYYKPLQ